MRQRQRSKTILQLRLGQVKILVATDVAARGIDVSSITHVINFDLPKCVHTYLHRIGRSGRWGRKGVGINFITRRDVGLLKKIEEHYSTQINEMPVEFSHGAFRFGHAMVRDMYKFNSGSHFSNVEIINGTRIQNSAGAFRDPLIPEWIVEWANFYDFQTDRC